MDNKMDNRACQRNPASHEANTRSENLNNYANQINPNLYKMDNTASNLRANQCNPNHEPTGPGHHAKYQGTGDKKDLDNHARNNDPNYKR